MTSDPTAPSADAAPSSSADDRAHLTLLAEISRAHFLDQKSKVQIAQEPVSYTHLTLPTKA